MNYNYKGLKNRPLSCGCSIEPKNYETKDHILNYEFTKAY